MISTGTGIGGSAYIGHNILKTDGASVMKGDLDMGNNFIHNLKTPTGPKDGANKSYVDTRSAMGKYDGSFNLNLANKRIINLGNPLDLGDAANKRYVDDAISKVKTETKTGNLDMGGYKVINSAAPTDSGDLTNRQYVGSAVSKAKPTGFLPLTGRTMRGNVEMGGKPITNVAAATTNSGVPNRLQVENIARTATSDRNMKGYKITNLGDPTESGDAVNLKHVSSYLPKTGGTVAGSLTVTGDVLLTGPKSKFSNAVLDKTSIDLLINTAQFDRNMNGHRIRNLPAPTASGDAANKGYVDGSSDSVHRAAFTNYLHLSGGTMKGSINMDGRHITNLAKPFTAKDAATKEYVDEHMHSSGRTPMIGNLNMNNKKIINLGTPTNPKEATNKEYVDANFLKLSGGSMTGNLNMGGAAIMGLEGPTSDSQAATKRYVDDTVSHYTTNKLPLASGTMSGDIDMSGHNITNVKLPSTIMSAHMHYAVPLSYVNGAFLKRDTAKLSANMDADGNKTINLKDLVDDGDAITKRFVTLHASNGIRADASGNVKIGGKVEDVSDPIANKDAINKEWAKYNIFQRYLPKTYLWELMETAQCIYKLDKASSSEVRTMVNGNTTEVVRLIDQSLSESDAKQSNQLKRPFLTTNLVNKYEFILFDRTNLMTCDINLNPVSGIPDIVNIFIVYRLKQNSSSPAAENPPRNSNYL